MDREKQLRVVVNHEEQYSIWFVDRGLPAGWRDVGFTGTKVECLEHIARVWVDLRPRSLRQTQTVVQPKPPEEKARHE
ncbi:MbtH family protein [Methylocystis sp.]|uniref:MbtH family protein n=1 Tax=Methylocystis sp. TaxID=1911079 RepID=UPI003DA2CD6B